MAVDDQSELSFSTPQGTLPRQPIFGGTAGLANVWLSLHPV